MKSKQNIPTVLTLSYILFLGLQILPVLMGSPKLWGIDQWYYFSKTTAVVLLILGLIPLFPFFRAAVMRGASRINSARIVKRIGSHTKAKYLVLLAVAAVSFWMLRQSTHFLGDGYLWASRMYSNTLFNYMRPLSSSIYQIAYAAVNAFWRPAADSSFAAAAMVSIASGLVFLVFAYKTVRACSTDSVEQMFLFFAILSSGATTLFFGYVEAYPPVAAGLMAYIYYAIRYMQGREKGFFVTIVFLVNLSLHVTMIALLPSLIVILLSKGNLGRIRKKLVPAFSLLIALGLAALWIARKEALFSGFFNETFLPYFSIAHSGRTAYAMISPKHAFDCINEILLICPIVTFGIAGLWRGAKEKDKGLANVVLFLESLLLFYIIEYVLFKKLLGAARDWDIFSPLAIPLSLCVALLLLKRFRNIGRELAIFAFALLALHTGPWVGINSSQKRSLDRFADLTSNGYWTVYARAYGYELLAKHYLLNNDDSQSLYFFKKALDTDPKNRRYPYDLARISMHAKQYSEAFRLYREILDREPASWEALNALGLIYEMRGKNEPAEQMFLEATRVAPTFIDAYGSLATLYERTNRIDRAIAMLEKCIEIVPNASELYTRIAGLYERIGDHDKAELYAHRASELGKKENK